VYSTVFEVRAAVSPSGGSDNPPDVPTGSAADLGNTALTDSINEADSTIDSYIGGRYATPVVSVGDPAVVPHPIDYWSRNIAAYLATLTFRNSMDFTDNDPIARRYNATMLALTAVRDGKATLSIPELGADSAGEASGAAPPYQQYEGHMFDTKDFDLVPDLPGWNRIPGYYPGRPW
jgi:phage gp36-like protein